MVKPATVSEFTTLADVARTLQKHSELNLPALGTVGLLTDRGGLQPSELADLLGLGSDHMSKILKSLQADGFVVFKLDEKDQRKKRFYVTEAGYIQAVKWLEARGLPVRSRDEVQIAKITPARIKGPKNS